ncbi:hypothetical protein CWI38_1021p0010, partial [Hamiltosporidium tvaerminnensis]
MKQRSTISKIEMYSEHTRSMWQHCNKPGKLVDHLTTRCEKMLSIAYTRRHNAVLLLKINLTNVETKKLRKYGLLANELGLIYRFGKYIQSILLMKTVETISFDRRRGLESGLNAEESWERA